MRADMERGRDASLRPTVMRAVVLGAIASIIGIVVALAINWFPPAASKQADRIDTLWDVLLICSIPIFVLVSTVVVVSVIKFRMRPGEEELDGPPIHGNTRLEVIWTAIPATLLIALCAYAYIVLHDIEKAPAAQELNVKVTGQQFTWTFEYRGTNGKTFTVPQLFVPEGQSVRFNIVSKDVLHDFWVPAFRMKIDAVPGIVTHYRVTPTETGTFPVVCAELCGLGHAFMRQTAHVMTKPQFAAWVQRTSRAAGGGGGGQAGAAPDAKALFTNGSSATGATACGACHTLQAAGTSGTTGPNLDQVLKGKDPAFIKQSILQPDAQIASGFSKGIMPPNYRSTLKPAEVDAIVKFLSDATK
jgi:cytochrome c oxidase subunit 2